MGRKPDTLPWALNKTPKVGQEEQENIIGGIDDIGGIQTLGKGDVIRIWNKEGCLIATYVVSNVVTREEV